METPVFLQSDVIYRNDGVKLSVARRGIAEYADEAYNSDATRNNSSQNLEQVLTALDNNK